MKAQSWDYIDKIRVQSTLLVFATNRGTQNLSPQYTIFSPESRPKSKNLRLQWLSPKCSSLGLGRYNAHSHTLFNFPKPRHGLQRLPSQHQHQHLRVQLESITMFQLRVYYTLHSPFPTFFTSSQPTTCRSWWARTSLRTESSTALRRRSSKPVCFRSADAEGSLRTNTTRSRGRPAKLLEGTERGCLLSFPYLNKSKFIFFLVVFLLTN